MADKKISELTELTTPDGTEELVVNDSGVSKKITQANLFKLGDNVKAKFGTGDDLEIYHDGVSSYVSDTGTGSLRLRGSSQIRLEDASGTQMISMDSGGASKLYHNGTKKLDTTATGIDVTGSVTCDGFTSTGIDDNATSTAITIDTSENVTLNGSSPQILVGSGAVSTGGCALQVGNGRTGDGNSYLDLVGDTTYTDYGTRILRGGGANAATSLTTRGTGNFQLQTEEAGAMVFKTSATERMRILPTGGITFNGDTAAANALDDYEEGTWTPTINLGTVTVGTCKYIKIGNEVTLYGALSAFTDSTSATQVIITGLPFANGGGLNGIGSVRQRYWNVQTTPVVTISGIYFYGNTTGNWNLLSYNDNLSASYSMLNFTATYLVS